MHSMLSTVYRKLPHFTSAVTTVSVRHIFAPTNLLDFDTLTSALGTEGSQNTQVSGVPTWVKYADPTLASRKRHYTDNYLSVLYLI